MEKHHRTNAPNGERRFFTHRELPLLAGVPVRSEDIEPARGLHSVALLFRGLAGLLGVIIVLQIANGITSPGVSYGALLAEVIRLVIFAGLLWGAGELADLFVRSHHDLRGARILLARLHHQMAQDESTDPRPGGGRRGPDATH